LNNKPDDEKLNQTNQPIRHIDFSFEETQNKAP